MPVRIAGVRVGTRPQLTYRDHALSTHEHVVDSAVLYTTLSRPEMHAVVTSCISRHSTASLQVSHVSAARGDEAQTAEPPSIISDLQPSSRRRYPSCPTGTTPILAPQLICPWHKSLNRCH